MTRKGERYDETMLWRFISFGLIVLGVILFFQSNRSQAQTSGSVPPLIISSDPASWPADDPAKRIDYRCHFMLGNANSANNKDVCNKQVPRQFLPNLDDNFVCPGDGDQLTLDDACFGTWKGGDMVCSPRPEHILDGIISDGYGYGCFWDYPSYDPSRKPFHLVSELKQKEPPPPPPPPTSTPTPSPTESSSLDGKNYSVRFCTRDAKNHRAVKNAFVIIDPEFVKEDPPNKEYPKLKTSGGLLGIGCTDPDYLHYDKLVPMIDQDLQLTAEQPSFEDATYTWKFSDTEELQTVEIDMHRTGSSSSALADFVHNLFGR